MMVRMIASAGGNPNHTGHVAFQTVQLRLKFFLPPQHIFAQIEVEPPGIGDGQRPGAPVQQHDAQMTLQVLNRLAG